MGRPVGVVTVEVVVLVPAPALRRLVEGREGDVVVVVVVAGRVRVDVTGRGRPVDQLLKVGKRVVKCGLIVNSVNAGFEIAGEF